ncbi:HD domain-containing phosphohydrolase [Deinococcus cellulosilyticus]|nr:HD domain-containing phosphohydrolase [Deinococcus cellulosilyticus]
MIQLAEQKDQTTPTEWLDAALELGRQAIASGVTEDSIRFAQLAADHARHHHLHEHLVVALDNLGNLLFYHDQPYDALSVLSEAALLLESSALMSEKARNSNLQGAVYMILGSPENAYRHFTNALSLSRNTGDALMEAKVLNNMALLLGQQEKLSDALDILAQIQSLYRKLGNSNELCKTILNKTELKLKLPASAGLYLEIEQDLQEAEGLLGHQDNAFLRIMLLQCQATLHCRRHDLPEARSAAQRALELSETHQIDDLRAHTHVILGEILSEAGAPEEAVEHLLSSMEFFRALDYQDSRVPPLKLLVKILKQLGRFEEALQYHEELYHLDLEIRSEAASKQLELMAFQRKLEQSQHEAELERIRNEELEMLVQERTAELESAYLEMLERLAVAAEFRDSDTGEHTVRVGERAAEVARELGMPEEKVRILRLAARLHDVGKIAISDTILHKPGKLTEDEYLTMKAHTLAGARMLSEARSELIRMAEQIALTHHEKWDGTGYPHGLQGEAIPLEGRIVAVVDVLDALTSTRPYKRAWTLQEALHEIEIQAGQHFDPQVVQALLKIYRREQDAEG